MKAEFPIRVPWTADARAKFTDQVIAPAVEEGREWAEEAEAVVNRTSTRIVMTNASEAEAILSAIDHVRNHPHRQSSWMKADHLRSIMRVYDEITDEIDREDETEAYSPPEVTL